MPPAAHNRSALVNHNKIMLSQDPCCEAAAGTHLVTCTVLFMLRQWCHNDIDALQGHLSDTALTLRWCRLRCYIADDALACYRHHGPPASSHSSCSLQQMLLLLTRKRRPELQRGSGSCTTWAFQRLPCMLPSVQLYASQGDKHQMMLCIPRSSTLETWSCRPFACWPLWLSPFGVFARLLD